MQPVWRVQRAGVPEQLQIPARSADMRAQSGRQRCNGCACAVFGGRERTDDEGPASRNELCSGEQFQCAVTVTRCATGYNRSDQNDLSRHSTQGIGVSRFHVLVRLLNLFRLCC